MKKFIFLLISILFLSYGNAWAGDCNAAYLMTGTTTETDLCSADANTDTLSATGTVSQSADVPTGYTGNSRDFELDDGTEYLSVAETADTDIQDNTFSIVAQIKPDSVTAAATRTIVSKWDGSTNKQYTLQLGTDGTVTFAFSANGSTNAGIITTTATIVADWQCIAGVYDGTKLIIYLNGFYSAESGAVSSNVFNGSDDFRVGARGDGLRFDGLMTHVYLDGGALTALEVFQQCAFGIDGLQELSGWEWADDYLLLTTNWGAEAATPVVNTIDEDDDASAPYIGPYSSSSGDVTAPEVDTLIINASGSDLFITFTESVTINNSTGFSLSGTDSGQDIASCNTESTPMDCILDAIVETGDSGILLTYSGAPAHAIQDDAGNDLADFADAAVTNNSTQSAPQTSDILQKHRHFYYR